MGFRDELLEVLVGFPGIHMLLMGFNLMLVDLYGDLLAL